MYRFSIAVQDYTYF